MAELTEKDVINSLPNEEIKNMMRGEIKQYKKNAGSNNLTKADLIQCLKIVKQKHQICADEADKILKLHSNE